MNFPKPISSHNYWIERYNAGGNSGPGSYNRLAEFKAEILNTFVAQENIKTIIEYGCGDGNQLKLAQYLSYRGYDISQNALSRCEKAFSGDTTKAFLLMNEYGGERADLTLSLDVIYHLHEDTVFEEYMQRLFDSAERFVIIYSSNTDINVPGQHISVINRNFSKWVAANRPDWKLRDLIPNRYPYIGDANTGSRSDFYIYKKV